MTILGILALLGLFIWGMVLVQKNGSPLGAVMTLVAMGGVLVCLWQYVLAIALVVFMGWAMLRTVIAVLSSGDGGQLVKGFMVVAAMILALPPFWPISIPLALCLVAAYLALAPISLLVGVVRDFMER